MKTFSKIDLFVSIFAVIWLILSSACSDGGGTIAVSLDPSLAGASEAKLSLYLVDQDPNIIHMHLQAELPGARHAELLEAYRERVAALGKVRSDLNASRSTEFDAVADGSYWVVTLEPLASGELRLFWAEPVRVENGRSEPIRLTLSNATLVLDENECVLNR